mgnify:CR=1 FL=1
MYKTCPKCGFESGESNAPPERCPSCGLIYSKWLKSLASDPEYSEKRVEATGTGGRLAVSAVLGRMFLREKPDVNRGEVFGYGLIWLLLLWWGLDFLAMDFRSAEIMNHWFHNVDLIFHEAGHVIFRPLGRWMMFLGGSAFQVLLPLGLMVAFLVMNKDGFSGSACLWWAGQSMKDVAPYIADARALRLPLLGGGTGADNPGTHDWANLLRPLGMLNEDIRIASIADTIGSGLILIALVWGAYMLWVYYRAAIN